MFQNNLSIFFQNANYNEIKKVFNTKKINVGILNICNDLCIESYWLVTANVVSNISKKITNYWETTHKKKERKKSYWRRILQFGYLAGMFDD